MLLENSNSAIWNLRKKNRVFSIRKKPNHPPKYRLKQYVIWVFRIPNDEEQQKLRKFKESAPCNECKKELLKMGFTKCCHTDDYGEIQCIDLRSHVGYETSSQSNTKNLCIRY